MEKQIILGESNLHTQALEQLSLVAPLNKPVLICGERGTGKELIAERLHFLSSRWQKPFLKINCAALSENLLESTLFGHDVGAFTGAIKTSKGFFERANEGTLFLDELGTVSVQVQEKLLRVIEYGEFERLGGQQAIQCDVRIVAATNANLIEMAKEGTFRADLLDRLAFDVVNLPPLRYRQEDILILAEYFAMSMTRELSRDAFMGFSESAICELQSYQWPGNIRELKNVVQRSVYRHQDDNDVLEHIVFDPFSTPWDNLVTAEIADSSTKSATPEELNMHSGKPHNITSLNITGQIDLKQHLQTLEFELISRQLVANHYHQKKTAKALGLTYHQLRAYLKKYPDLLSS
jgi:psp operon transcriptional activator